MDREPTLVASDMAFVGWLVAIVAVVLLLAVAFWVWRKGRPFAPGDVFRASRFSRGNRLFPTQVLITASSVVHYTPQWIGRREKSIHMAHVASVNIDTGVLFSDVVIETSGGEHPVACHGHRKGDAVQMKALIERHQGAYYRGQGGGRPPGGDVAVQ